MKYIFFVSRRLTPRALSAWLICFIFLVCISLLSATAWQMKQSRDERLANARVAVFNLVRAAEQQAQDTVRQADNLLRDLAERVEVDGTEPAQRLRLFRLMARNVETVEGIQGLFIYNENGDWIANSFSQGASTKNNSDRPYFVYHRDNPDSSIHIGSIITSRTTGEVIIPISRRLQYPDGRFAGVALAAVSVAYFQHFFERLDVDEKGVIFLALDDGKLLARRPTVGAMMTTNISTGEIFTKYLALNDNGTAILTSVVDGIERVYAYRRLQGLPIVTAAGLSCEFVFAQWWTYAYHSFAIAGLIIAALVLLGFVLYRQIQQLLAAESQLNRARQELELMAQTDSLTGIANRRCLDTTLGMEWERARRSGSSLAVILLDIDWFKQYNDHYGHILGDQCLKQVARLIQSTINRSSDLVARYGGEEFVILFSDTNLAGASSVAEKVRSAIAAAQLEHVGSPLGIVTISAGVCATEAGDIETSFDLLQRADSLLYCAKGLGRNRIQDHPVTASRLSEKGFS